MPSYVEFAGHAIVRVITEGEEPIRLRIDAESIWLLEAICCLPFALRTLFF
jgi:hypothetical protein